MRFSSIKPAGLALASLLALGACATNTSNDPNHGSIYTNTSAQRPAQSQEGVITSMRIVQLRSDGAQFAGALAGGAVGGLVGSQFGDGRGRDILTAAGAVGGAVAGATIGEQKGRQNAQEWTVRLNDGRGVAVIQNGNFYVGQPVRVIVDNTGRARITAR